MSDANSKLILAIIGSWMFAVLAATSSYRTDKVTFYPKLSVTLHPLLSFLLFLYPRRKKIPIACIIEAAASIISIIIVLILDPYSDAIPENISVIWKNCLFYGIFVCGAIMIIDDRINYPDVDENFKHLEDYLKNPKRYRRP